MNLLNIVLYTLYLPTSKAMCQSKGHAEINFKTFSHPLNYPTPAQNLVSYSIVEIWSA